MISLHRSESRKKLSCIEKVRVGEPEIEGKSIKGKYQVDGENISLSFRYDLNLTPHQQDMRMMFLIPLVNYSLFTEEIEADFPITIQDKEFLRNMMVINSREVYVNKLLKRKEFYKEEWIPENPSNEEASYSPKLNIAITENKRTPSVGDGSVALLSSGGKDSLVSYGMMNEVGAKIYPIYINESGGHWNTAKTAYEYFKNNSWNTLRVWTTIDRFYKSMNLRVRALSDRALSMWSDTYPVQLFLFPVYIFSLIPYIEKLNISSVMKGDEFDDPRGYVPEYGINHFYGVYDQSQEFDKSMNEYFRKIGYGVKFFSAVRSISGLIEERILFERYPKLAKLQRSCHSCHLEGNQIVPCGKCSKCNGVMLFLLANSIDPATINYKEQDIKEFKEDYKQRTFRLDADEKEHSMFLLSNGKSGVEHDHVEKIHKCKEFCDTGYISEEWRGKVMGIIEKYTNGTVSLQKDNWN